VADVQMRNQFPQINSFDSQHELQQIYANPAIVKNRQVDSPSVDGGHALQIIFGTKKYAGFRLVGPYGDWTKYEYLTMDFYNPESEPLEIALRISDRKHDNGVYKFEDRFNRRFQLTAGWNKVRIGINEIRNAPLKREMDMDEISGFGIFVEQLQRSRQLYWDNIHLE
jgi:hypothetical protein